MRLNRWAILSAVALAGAGYLFLCGRRRLLLGLAFAYTGGFEVFSGRLPYRDFEIVIGPVIFLLQGLFFKLFGVNYAWGYLGHAAALNALAAVMIFDAAQRRTGRLVLALGAAALTAVWFYPIYYASPWYDAESFFFLIASVWMMERAGEGRRAPVWLAAAGAAAAVAFFTKQSNGAAGLAGLALCLAASSGARKTAAFAAGAAAGLLGLGALCYSWAGSEFLRQFLVAPMQAGRLAFLQNPVFWVVAGMCAALAAGWKPLRSERWFLAPFALAVAAITMTSWMYLVFLMPLAFLPLMRDARDRGMLFSLVLIQLAGRLVSNNELKQFWPFLGFLFALAAKACLDWKKSDEDVRLMKRGLAALFGLLFCVGIRLSFWRAMWPPFPATTLIFAIFLLVVGWSLDRRSKTAAFLALAAALVLIGRCILVHARRLHEPDRSSLAYAAESSLPALRGIKMSREEASSLDALVRHLRSLPEDRRRVFLYQGCELIYSLLEQTLPQPLLWFDPTLVFHPNDGTETRVLSALKRNGVRTIVLCKPQDDMGQAMPQLKRLIETSSTLELRLPLYDVYRLHESPPSRLRALTPL